MFFRVILLVRHLFSSVQIEYRVTATEDEDDGICFTSMEEYPRAQSSRDVREGGVMGPGPCFFYSAREPAKPILNSHTVFLSSNCAISLYPGDQRNYKHVESLQFHSTTQSH
jgi:hypothetical protein